MRADEEAMSKTRPWQRLELVPAYDRKKLLNSAKGECLHEDYVFGKNIDQNELENVLKSFDERIKIFNYPFVPMPLAKGIKIDPVYWREAFAQARLYLLGTTHYSHQSISDVQNLMRTTQPDIVFVELCKRRAIEQGGISYTDEEVDQKYGGTFDECLDYVTKKEYPGKKFDDLGWLKRWLLKKQTKKIMNESWKKVKNLEFRAAFEMATKVRGCAGLVLGELPHAHVESIEIFNSKNVLDDKEFQKEVNEKVVGRRDRYMTKVMHTILHRCTLEKLCASYRIGVKFEPVTIVGIVGLRHLAGIERIWSKPEEIYLPK